jgi:hypothetical protein
MSQPNDSQNTEKHNKLDATIVLDDTQGGSAASTQSQSDSERNPFGDSQASSCGTEYTTGQESWPNSQATTDQESTLSQLNRTINLSESEASTQQADESWLHYDSQKWRYLYSQLENSQGSDDGQNPVTSTQEKKEEKSDQED